MTTNWNHYGEWLKLYQKCALGSVLIVLCIYGISLAFKSRPTSPDDNISETPDACTHHSHLYPLRSENGIGELGLAQVFGPVAASLEAGPPTIEDGNCSEGKSLTFVEAISGE